MEEEFRIETDSMGEMKVPIGGYWAAQTQRAVENFPISGIPQPRRIIRALGIVKRSAARANVELGKLEAELGDAIVKAATEVIEGKLDAHFPIDVFQTGSGTSSNMNSNEVISNRANEILGGKIGDKSPVHPNDKVNMGQSSNDVFPTAMHIAAMEGVEQDLLPGLRHLQEALETKAAAFDHIVKIGRTHLQDATPIRLGQEFSGYASQVAHGVRRIEAARNHMLELALGGTAVGTGLNTHRDFAAKAIAHINDFTGLEFREAENHFEAQGGRDAPVELSGALKTVAASLMKVANDIRFLGSGPRCGLGELSLPEVQPGSSIMPGKVNPVIAEALIQVCAHVMGNDVAITVSSATGYFELNVMMTVMAYNLLQSISFLGNAAENFATRCVEGLQANEERATGLVEGSLAMVTSLAPIIGYDPAAKIAKAAFSSGKTVREVALEQGVLPPDELEKALDPRSMTEPE